MLGFSIHSVCETAQGKYWGIAIITIINGDGSVFWAQRKSSVGRDINKSLRVRLAVPNQKVVVWIVWVLSLFNFWKISDCRKLWQGVTDRGNFGTHVSFWKKSNQIKWTLKRTLTLTGSWFSGIKKNTLKREICCNCPWRPNFNCGDIHSTSKRVCNIIKSNLQSPTPSVNK